MWKIVRHEEQGLSHKETNLPCQDKTYHLVENGVYTISLADGAGSCKYSHMGAIAVTQKVCEILCDNFDYLYELNDIDIAKKVMSSCILDLKDRYVNMDCDIKDFSSTLLFVAVKEDKYIAGHIGDGVIGFRHHENVEVLSQPQNGEYINSTYFITNTNSIDKFNIVKGDMKGVSGFILMSDGVSESLYDRKNKNLSKAAEVMINWLDNNSIKDIENALKSNFEDLFLKRTSDDCSVVLMKNVDIEYISKKNHLNEYLNLFKYIKKIKKRKV